MRSKLYLLLAALFSVGAIWLIVNELYSKKTNHPGILKSEMHWVTCPGGVTAAEVQYLPYIDARGNVYVTGYFQTEYIVFGKDTLYSGSHGMLMMSMGNLFLVKYNSDGKELWANYIYGTGDDNEPKITTDAAGNVFLTGTYNSPVLTFDKTVLSTNGDKDIFLAKYDSSGKLQWAKSAGGNKNECAGALNVDTKGAIYVTGSFESNGLIFGRDTLRNDSGSEDMFILKYNPDGKELWAATASGTKYSNGCAITTDDVGYVFVAGFFNGKTLYIPGNELHNSGSGNFFIAKYDHDGKPVWMRNARYNDSGYIDARYLITDASGNVYVSGVLQCHTVLIDNYTLTSEFAPQHPATWVAKYNIDGMPQWIKSPVGISVPLCMATDTVSNLYLGGDFESKTLIIGNDTLTKKSAHDRFIVKYDRDGNELAAISSSGSGLLDAMATNTAGNLWITGRITNLLEPYLAYGADTLTLNGVGQEGIYAIKYKQGN